MRLFIPLTLCLALFANITHAQEICNNNLDDDGDGLVDCRDGDCPGKVCEICDNGIDDDGDQFIDCYDKECSLNLACNDSFLGRGQKCEVWPDSFAPFQMKLKFKSAPNQANHLNRVIAGDINGDGIPELVTAYAAKTGTNMDQVSAVTASKINIFNAPSTGNTLTLTTSINVDANPGSATDLEGVGYEDIAMADINGDGCAEIFVITKNLSNNSAFKIIAYDCNQNPLWASPINLSFEPGVIGLADFDGDGLVELYSRTQIFDAHTGTLLGSNNIDNTNTGIHNGVNSGWGMNSNGPVAVNIDSNTPGLELVAGCRIYSVSINRGAMTATLTLTKEVPSYATRTSRGMGSSTSVADFNQDGFLDVLAVGSDGAYNANTTIFFWDVQNNVVKKYRDNSGNVDYINGWKNGAGRINIGDIDGDTLLNAVYVSGKYLYALKETPTTLDTLWRQLVNEETSGITGCTLFDFNGDGKTEIIYRDENYIYTYTTHADGTVTRSTPIRCSSRTHTEYPIVVDMDGDGSTEICITCSTSNTTNGKNIGMFDEAELRVYESANEPWMPARKVWNQHGYFVTNVNDDLTIPRHQQLHHLIFGQNALCRQDGTSRPFNSFMNQTAYLNDIGCPTYPMADLTLAPASSLRIFDYDPFTCLSDSIAVTVRFTNQGERFVNGEVPISFYAGNPESYTPLAMRLHTATIFVSYLHQGDTLTATVKLKNPRAEFDLFAVINDDGTTIPLDLTLQPGRILECSYDNTLHERITPSSLHLVPEVLQKDLLCLTDEGLPTPPHKGSVNARVLHNAQDSSKNFNLYWSVGALPKPTASVDFIGATFSGLASGPYTVYASHQTLSCKTDTITVVVSEDTSRVNAMIAVQKFNENYDAPNGRLTVIVNDEDYDGVGDPVSNFSYLWIDGKNVFTGDTLGVSSTLTNLQSGSYSVLVSDKVTGCYDSASSVIPAIEGAFGCPPFPSPNLVMISASLSQQINYTSYTCLNDSIQISFRYTNRGERAINNTVFISFYDGDPSQAIATRLDTKSFLISGMNPGDTLATTLSIKNPGIAFDLHIAVNDNGTTLPLNILAQTGHLIECQNDNVIYQHIIPDQLSLTAEVLQKDLTCLTAPGLPTPSHRGAARAYAVVDNQKDSTSFQFLWSIGTTTKPTADFTGSTVTGLASGAYTLYASHQTLNCNSNPVTVVVDEVSSQLDARIVLAKTITSNTIPDGELRAVVNDMNDDGMGDPFDNFTYAWYTTSDVLTGDVLGTQHLLTGLTAGDYAVVVSDKITGCYDSASITIPALEVVSNEEDAGAENLYLYPNPGTEGFTLQLENGYIGAVHIQLQSTIGNEVVRTFSTSKEARIISVGVDTQRLRAGVYLVKVLMGREVVVKKWTKH